MPTNISKEDKIVSELKNYCKEVKYINLKYATEEEINKLISTHIKYEQKLGQLKKINPNIAEYYKYVWSKESPLNRINSIEEFEEFEFIKNEQLMKKVIKRFEQEALQALLQDPEYKETLRKEKLEESLDFFKSIFKEESIRLNFKNSDIDPETLESLIVLGETIIEDIKRKPEDYDININLFFKEHKIKNPKMMDSKQFQEFFTSIFGEVKK